MSSSGDQSFRSGVGLLPAGLSDLMPVEASHQASVVDAILSSFSAMGYARVKPPLVEFEDTLLADGPGAALASNSFRVMDPQSGKMMAIRADMTAQIARIASTRLKHQSRPLRLAYSGDVLRVVPDPLNPERQLTQVGAEMIGACQSHHDAEVAVAAMAALLEVGVGALTIDLSTPRLLSVMTSVNDDLEQAVKAKDHALVQRYGGAEADILCRLLDMPMLSFESLGGRLAEVASVLEGEAARMVQELSVLAEIITKAMCTVGGAVEADVTVTVDPLESRGFDYYHGVGFAIFSPGIRGELGRGGRYRTRLEAASGEDSTGVTLYLERVLRALKFEPPARVLYIPHALGLEALVAEMRGGEQCRFGSVDAKDAQAAKAEARLLGCSHILQDGQKLELK